MWDKITEIWTDTDNIGDSYQVDYNKETGQYRVSIFKDYHFQDEIFFDEVEK